jgi:hypothetical protein
MIASDDDPLCQLRSSGGVAPSLTDGVLVALPDWDTALTTTSLHRGTLSLHDQSGQKKDIEDYVKSVVYLDSEPIMRRWRKEDKDMISKGRRLVAVRICTGSSQEESRRKPRCPPTGFLVEIFTSYPRSRYPIPQRNI